MLVLSAHMLPLGPKELRLNEAAGGMGMSLFFSLSGFLITATLIRNADILDFFVKRLARILPLAYAYTLLVFGIIHFDPAALFWTASFLLNYFPQYMIDGYNNHFWSLCVEVQFYFSIAIAVLVAGQRAIWIVWPACFIVTLLRIKAGVYYSIETHLRVDEILAGSCLATIYLSAPAYRKSQKAYFLLGALIFWFACSNPLSGWLQYLRPYSAALVVTAALSTNCFVTVKVLSSKPLRYIARVSYALYVIHPLTIHGWWNEGTLMQKYLVKRPISFAMTFLSAHLSTFYWEQFWQTAAKNWAIRRHERRSRQHGRA